MSNASFKSSAFTTTHVSIPDKDQAYTLYLPIVCQPSLARLMVMFWRWWNSVRMERFCTEQVFGTFVTKPVKVRLSTLNRNDVTIAKWFRMKVWPNRPHGCIFSRLGANVTPYFLSWTTGPLKAWKSGVLSLIFVFETIFQFYTDRRGA